MTGFYLRMYAYIYGHELLRAEYQGKIAIIEQRLVDFGIQGKIYRRRTLQDSRGLLDEAYRQGARTIIAVGGDEIANELVDWTQGEKRVTLGFLPLQEGGVIARALGIPAGVEACQALARRIIERVDIGRMGDLYFLSHLEISTPNGLSLAINNRAVVRLSTRDTVVLDNFAPLGDPRDGSMHLRILHAPERRSLLASLLPFRTRGVEESVFPVTRMNLLGTLPALVTLDGARTARARERCEVLLKRLSVIVGAHRRF